MSTTNHASTVPHGITTPVSTGFYVVFIQLPIGVTITHQMVVSNGSLQMLEIIEIKRRISEMGYNPMYHRVMKTGDRHWSVFRTEQIDYVFDNNCATIEEFHPKQYEMPIECKIFTCMHRLHALVYEKDYMMLKDSPVLDLFLTLSVIKKTGIIIEELNIEDWESKGIKIVEDIYKKLYPEYYEIEYNRLIERNGVMLHRNPQEM